MRFHNLSACFIALCCGSASAQSGTFVAGAHALPSAASSLGFIATVGSPFANTIQQVSTPPSLWLSGAIALQPIAFGNPALSGEALLMAFFGDVSNRPSVSEAIWVVVSEDPLALALQAELRFATLDSAPHADLFFQFSFDLQNWSDAMAAGYLPLENITESSINDLSQVVATFSFPEHIFTEVSSPSVFVRLFVSP